MPTVAIDQDVAGGAVTATATKCTVNGKAVVLLGDSVEEHGDDEHASATMKEGSLKFTVEGRPVCVTGDKATCDDAIVGTGVTASAP